MNSLKILVKHNFRSYLLIQRPEYYHRMSCLQSSIRNQWTQTKTGQNLKEKTQNLDLTGDSSGDQLIYSGPENVVKMIKVIKKFSLSTTLIAAGVQPFIFQQIIATNSSAFAIGFAGMTSAGIVLSPLLLNWFTKRYVTDLYYNYDTKVFTAWVLNLFCRRVSVQYRASDVSVPESLGMFTTYNVGPKRKPYFVDPEFVTDLTAYKVMLGYDKPLDIKLNQVLDDIKQNHKN